MPPAPHDRRQTDRVRWIGQMGGTFLLGALVAGILVICLLPILHPLAFGMVLAIACGPIQVWLVRLTRGRHGLAAFLVTCLVVLIVVVPAAFLGFTLTVEAGKAYDGLRTRVEGGELKQRVDDLAAITRAVLPADMAEDAARQIVSAVSDLGISALRIVYQRLLGGANSILQNLPDLAMDLVIMLISLFIFLRDGRLWISHWKNTVPLPPEFRHLVAIRILGTTRAAIHGMFIAAVAQALLVALGFKLFGVPLPVLFGVAAFFVSWIPYVGIPLLWLPACVWLWVYHDALGQAAGLFLYGAVLFSWIDNVLKPVIMGKGAHLPAYAMFLAIVGGLYALGPLGLFLAPVAFAVAYAALTTYRDMATVTAPKYTGPNRRRRRR